MELDPVLGSGVWIASSLGFLAASAAVVRMLDGRTVTAAGATGRLPLDLRTRSDEQVVKDDEEGVAD